MELNDTLRDCIIKANNEYPDLDFPDTVIKAFQKYVSITGAPVELEDDEEAMDLMNKVASFLIDCSLFNMMEKGVLQIAGIDEDGDLIYQVSIEV